MRIAVIGAGPAGMTAALCLQEGGAQVALYEAGEQVGGLARSIDLWGQRVDLGPHRFFSTDARVNRLWLSIVGRDYRMVDRLTRIYYRDKFFHYPLKPLDVLAKLGPRDAFGCIASYAREQLSLRAVEPDDHSFEAWVVSRFGRRLFEMFFKSYSEKLWGISCRELDADFAAQRIRKFSLIEAMKHAFAIGRKPQHRTLVDRFAYPTGGTGAVYEAMGARFRALGGELNLRSPVRRVLNDEHVVQGIELSDGRYERCEHVISTMPLSLLVRGFSDVPHEVQASANALKFRNTVLVYLQVDADKLFPDQWIYIHAPQLRAGRVTNFRNWVPELYGADRKTILAVEYWANDDDALWRNEDAELIRLATDELRTTRLLGDAPVLAGHVVRVPRCYPVYARGYREHVARLADFLRQFRGLTPIGRYGAFKYNSQDHSMLMGILAAENLLESRHHDLWAVNTDYENYQESAFISDTGLIESGQSAVGGRQ